MIVYSGAVLKIEVTKSKEGAADMSIAYDKSSGVHMHEVNIDKHIECW